MLNAAHIAETNFDKAAEGLLINAQKLIAAGYFEAAKTALEHLLQPGPWGLKKHGQLVQQLEGLMPLVCFLCGADCPKIGTLGAMSAPAVAAWAADETATYIDMLKMPVRNQLKVAGIGWSVKLLDALIEMRPSEATRKAFSAFCIDAEFVLKARLSADNNASTSPNTTKPEHASTWLQDVLQGKPPTDFDALDGLGIGEMLAMVSPIMVDDAAALIDEKKLCEVILRYHTKSGEILNYNSLQLLAMLLHLSLQRADNATATQAATALTASNGGLASLMNAATYEPVAALLQSHVCAAGLGIDDNTVAQYLAALTTRAPQPIAKKTAAAPLFIDTFATFSAHLKGSVFAKKKFVTLPVCDTAEQAYAIACDPADAKALWEAAVALVPQTGRWPVVTTCWSTNGKTADALLGEDIFSRFYFEGEAARDDVSPAVFMAAAKKIKLDAALRRIEKEMVEDDDDASDMPDLIEHEIFVMRADGRAVPTAEEVAVVRLNGKPLKNRYELERWFLDWEIANGHAIPPPNARPEFFEPEQTFLLFLPTPNSWEALAYLAFYGRDRVNSETCIALAKRWFEQYGATLYAHFGTMLEFYTASTPATLDDAWQLAKEHDLTASCTLALPGISLRYYAVSLMHTNAWFLHERP